MAKRLKDRFLITAVITNNGKKTISVFEGDATALMSNEYSIVGATRLP